MLTPKSYRKLENAITLLSEVLPDFQDSPVQHSTVHSALVELKHIEAVNTPQFASTVCPIATDQMETIAQQVNETQHAIESPFAHESDINWLSRY